MTPDPTPACEQDAATIDALHARIDRLEARDDWKQRAIDAEANIRDIADRLNRASDALRTKARDAERKDMDFEAARLRGKHEGVRLAWSYVEEYLRAALSAADPAAAPTRLEDQ